MPGAVYQNTFDLAAGGANLTRATMDGMPLANPSLVAIGPGFWRSIFFRTAFHGAAAPTSLIQKSIRDKKLDTESLAQLQNAHLRFGQDIAAGALTSLFSFTTFATYSFDIEGEPSEIDGIPAFSTAALAYSGAYGTFSKSFGDTFAVGANSKFIYSGQSALDVEPLDLINQSQLLSKAKNSLAKGQGIGMDLGMTFQKRTQFFDLRLATTLDDLGDTTFTGDIPAWKQSVNMGAAFTLHSNSQALHCGYDIRDVGEQYGLPIYLRTHIGCRAIVAKWFALAGGYGQNLPSYGILLNLFFFRLEAGSYGKVLSMQKKLASRQIYYLSLGFEVL